MVLLEVSVQHPVGGVPMGMMMLISPPYPYVPESVANCSHAVLSLTPL